MNQGPVSILSEEDLASAVLSDLKRVVREYATAATESNCPIVRQLFTDMLNSTLTMQGQLYQVMSNLNMYAAPASALKQEVDKQIQSYKQTQQNSNNWVSQHLNQANSAMMQNNMNGSQPQASYMQ